MSSWGKAIWASQFRAWICSVLFIIALDLSVHNALVPRFCPIEPFLRGIFSDEVIWPFPPLDVLGITLKFLVSSKREGIPFSCCVLLPEQSSASWFKYLTHFSSIKRFNPGSDLFSITSDLGFIRDRPIRSFWRVVRLDSVGR